jgi:predicted dehydrogenase/threonine dehydrogenase-like Zn-dependent dehydrogenase
MKQVIQNLRTGKTSVVEVPKPIPKAGTVLVKTAISLVSAGTERMLVEFAGKSLVGKARSRPDLVRQVMDKARREGLLTTVEAAFNRLDQPMVLGYSSAGTIVELGTDVQGFRVGERVACAGGGYAVHAEYAVVPKNLLTPLPPGVEFESGAFTTLGAIAMHGFRLAEPQLGEQVVVIGLGLLGLLTVGIASAAGCHVFGVDLDPNRVALAEQLGASAVLRDQAEEGAQAFTRGRGADAVLICADTASNDPVQLAGNIARDRARVVAVGAVGLDIPRNIYFDKELTFTNSRSYGPGRYDPDYEESGQDYPIGYVRWTEGRNMESFVELLNTKKLDARQLITHRFPIASAPNAYELITGKIEEPFLGVLLTYPQTETESPTIKPVPERKTHSEVKGKVQVDKVTLGVLGAGNFANAVMLPAINSVSAVESIAIASGSGLNAKHAADKYNFQYVAENEAQILDDPDINTIALLTRHNLHAKQVIGALEAGKHVFCEKPLALNEEELTQIYEALEQKSVIENEQLLTVGFNRRFAPLARELHNFITERTEPLVMYYRVNAGYLPLDHWLHDPQQGGGRIIGEACHFVDFLTFLVGEPPSSVTARGMPDMGRYRDDNVVMTFTYPDGSIGTVSYLANGDRAIPKEYLEVFCGGRVAVLDDFRSLELVHDGKRKISRSRLRQDKGHQAEWDEFSKAIMQAGPAPIPYDHLFGATRATFSAVQALYSGEEIEITS